MPFHSLPHRNLACDELEALAGRVAIAEDLWREHVHHPEHARHFASLYRDEHVDIWLLCWNTVSDTGWHDHDISSGAVHVLQGALIESSPRIGGDHASREVHAGATFSFGPEHIHRISGLEANSVSIHAYSPPLWRLGQYSIGEDGLMRRLSVSYAEELRDPDRVLVA